MVRVQPGQLDAVMKAAEKTLFAIDANRILRTRSMSELRAQAYRGEHGLVVLLSSICAALLIVTAFGIIGFTSYCVGQRRQQIRILRALAATPPAIVPDFSIGNFL